MSKLEKIHNKIYFKIISEMKNKGISQSEISQKIGTSPSSLNQTLKKLEAGKGITTEMLFKILIALEIKTELLK